MTFQVVIPYLSLPWSLEDCLLSFGSHAIPILIVDNSPNSDVSKGRFVDEVPQLLSITPTVTSYPQNIGVAASWNLGLDCGADYTIICSQSCRLTHIPLSAICDKITSLNNPYGVYFGGQGYHFIAIGRALVDLIGNFDENFWPGYGEDDDYTHRMQLAGVGYVDDGECGVTSIGWGIQKRSGVLGNLQWVGRIRSYYEHKWGSIPGHFPTPFNNPDNDLDYYPHVRK